MVGSLDYGLRIDRCVIAIIFHLRGWLSPPNTPSVASVRLDFSGENTGTCIREEIIPRNAAERPGGNCVNREARSGTRPVSPVNRDRCPRFDKRETINLADSEIAHALATPNLGNEGPSGAKVSSLGWRSGATDGQPVCYPPTECRIYE